MIKYRINRTAVEARMMRKKWTYADLARELGVTRQRVYQILRGGSYKNAEPLAKLFDCDPIALITTKRGQ